MIDTILNPRPGDIGTATGSIVNTFSALSLPAYWRAINFLADNLASFDIDVCKDEAACDESHYLDYFFCRMANPIQSAHSFWHTWFYHGEHLGNGYAYIRRPKIGSAVIASLHNLLPEDVTPFRLIPDNASIFDATLWYWHGPSKKAFPSADILHYHGLAYDGLIGYSPVQVLTSAFRGAQNLQKYSSEYVEKGTMVRGAIELPAGTSKETALEIIETLKKFRGATGDRDVLVLSGGAKLNNSTLSASDTQLIQQDQAATKKISQITGVPPQFLFEQSEAKYNNSAEQNGLDLVKFCFRTRIENIENELTIKLLTETELAAGYSIELDADALLRGDAKTQSDIATASVGGGLRTKNEGRELLGLPADPNPESNILLTPTAVASAPKPDPVPNE